MTRAKLDLPEGWRSEISTHDRYLHITRPRVGCVSIEWQSRVARPGHVYHGTPILEGYTGRRWRERLLADAVAWLAGLEP